MTGFSNYRFRVFYHERIRHYGAILLSYWLKLPCRYFQCAHETHTRINELARSVGWRGGSDRRGWEIVPYRRSAQLAGNTNTPTAVEIVYIFYQDRLPQTA